MQRSSRQRIVQTDKLISILVCYKIPTKHGNAALPGKRTEQKGSETIVGKHYLNKKRGSLFMANIGHKQGSYYIN